MTFVANGALRVKGELIIKSIESELQVRPNAFWHKSDQNQMKNRNRNVYSREWETMEDKHLMLYGVI